jgi:ribonuclease G
MNGFGFVQLVARLEGPSLLHRFATARLGMAARMALRRAELAADDGAGRALLLTVHPALKAKLKPEWLSDLARRTGREVRIETDPGLAIEGAHAQLLKA